MPCIASDAEDIHKPAIRVEGWIRNVFIVPTDLIRLPSFASNIRLMPPRNFVIRLSLIKLYQCQVVDRYGRTEPLGKRSTRRKLRTQSAGSSQTLRGPLRL